MSPAKTKEETEYVELTRDEKELVEYSLEGDWFFKEGWQKYGEDWPAYVPTNINLAMQYFFNMTLLPHQLQGYYCPIPDVCIHGARGSGKTVAFACMNALWTVLHPGNNWLHTSPSVEQATISYIKIIERAMAGLFFTKFIRHHREAPVPTIFFKKWDANDPGSLAQFRSIGQNPMELLRTFEAGRVTADEAFRTQTSDGPYRILAGMARGPNDYILNQNPELKEEYDALAMSVSTELSPLKRKALQKEMDVFGKKHGLPKDVRMMLYGNIGAYTWEWERYNWGIKNPSKRWSITWTSDMNPYYTEEQKDLLRQQFKDDPDGLSVEMRGTRPVAIGDIFTGAHVEHLFDGKLDQEALEAIDDEKRKHLWKWEVHEDYGVVLYTKPAEPGATYCAGGDPGTGRVPHRNKWCNYVFRIDRQPYELVYFSVGNLYRAGQGSIAPWILDCKKILQLYKIPEGHFAAEATGPQKGVQEVVWPDELRIVPLVVTTMKPTLIMQAQLMLSRHKLVSPNIALLEQELLGYRIMDKGLAQDCVMALLAAVFCMWPYVAEEFEVGTDEEQDEEEAWETGVHFRDVRDRTREVRTR